MTVPSVRPTPYFNDYRWQRQTHREPGLWRVFSVKEKGQDHGSGRNSRTSSTAFTTRLPTGRVVRFHHLAHAKGETA